VSPPAEERANLRTNIAAYGFDGMPLGEQPWGYERRSGSDRRRRPEQRFPERRSGVDRRTEPAAGA
jgi:hypothetical protein